ncbi:hypothetical protein ACH46N_10550 [Streptomyces pristinaespiralis]|uniref:LuxR family transcriptional regulator n=2 Tax=Streptomyces pristinaespiralis TaxID=38300 RepID=B5HAQ9_STRE2|nr:hypothetical protein [Streptomyces pristinaespiralis]ALC25073.1 LuxR family transcriptional regulator [Streptomyces pristinaespiralis]EDY63920.1 conserved hypothetical protein [Streptomyces pristinaespiralis ATCC 25486]QMU12663.1 hypothetical protein H3L99_02930 [Streptomyces pristinaespiralis]
MARGRPGLLAGQRGSVAAGPGALATEGVQALSRLLPGGGAAHTNEWANRAPAAPILLFLDDVDPVHAQCTGLVQHLLMALPAMRELVTSRQALGLGEEHVLRLSPLTTATPAGRSGHAPAVELFLERARRRVVAGILAPGRGRRGFCGDGVGEATGDDEAPVASASVRSCHRM